MAHSVLREQEAPPWSGTAPEAGDVARRALCVELTWHRLHLERTKDCDPDSLTASLKRWLTMLLWAAREGLTAHASSDETRWWTTALGELDVEEAENLGWVAASLTPLCWALWHFVEMPPYDSYQLPERKGTAGVPMFHQTEPFIARAFLRPRAEIDRARDIAELWWIRAMMLAAEGDPDEQSAPLDTLRAKFATRRRALEPYLPFADDDLVVFGKPYQDLDVDEHRTCWRIASGRLFALNWLCGHADWEAISVDPL